VVYHLLVTCIVSSGGLGPGGKGERHQSAASSRVRSVHDIWQSLVCVPVFQPIHYAGKFSSWHLLVTPTTQLIVWIQIVLSAAGAVVAWWNKPYLMHVIFCLLFMPYGLYVSLHQRVWVWIGVAELAYLAAAIWLHRSSNRAIPVR
jgi:hypothetical protein